jgi:hypothetical protein
MSKEKYSLEIYEPGSHDTCWVVFNSSTPFMAINKGDIINPNVWEGSRSPMFVLRAVKIEHIIWESPKTHEAKHKVMVFTEEIENK